MTHNSLKEDKMSVQPSTQQHLDSLTERGREVYLEWSMQQKLPHLRTINGVAGDILDDVIDCYRAAQKMDAFPLSDHILGEACKVGKTADLVLAQTHIDTAYVDMQTKETSEDPLCRFLTAITIYYEREPLPGTPKIPSWITRPVYHDLPAQFKLDMFMTQSKSIIPQNPCLTPDEFMIGAQHITKREQSPTGEDAARNA